MALIQSVAQCLFVFLYLLPFPVSTIKCLENGRFYRNPERPIHQLWSSECSKYYLCLDGEVFDFRCSPGLFFDIKRQICDVTDNVKNCDISTESKVNSTQCSIDQSACNDGTCISTNYICDGAQDCIDNSDETNCDATQDPNSAQLCNKSCDLPNCFCSLDGTAIPGNLDKSKVPQMILLTFDGAINSENFELLNRVLFNNRRNPNGCPIKATFFVDHDFNNYQQTQKLWNRGHEIAVHSITHRNPREWWSQNATIEDWFDEMLGQANILHKFASIRMKDIIGLRAPFLELGWNRQFLMMKEFGFVYDSSIMAPFSNPPLWPYTLDHKIPHDCHKQNCPSGSYPGVWEMVLNPLEVDGYSCPMLDTCSRDFTGDDIYRVLMHNFQRHYTTNRAPFGLHFQSAWFKKQEHLDAFQDFVSETLQQTDVWFVTNSQAISWIKNPISMDRLNTFGAWDCNTYFEKHEIACKVPNVCKLRLEEFQQERYFYTCFPCPEQYPWLRNEFGHSQN